MNSYIKSRIENLRNTLSWREAECEKSRMSLVERAAKCTAEEIAHGWLESGINDIGREVEEIKSIRDQIKLLEHILKTASREARTVSSYYYTFGSDPGFPYRNGWVLVKAATREEADQKFLSRFPDQPGHEGIMNCSFCYDEERWEQMDPEHTWTGWKCHEVIE